jgi:hypothetical protein
LATITLAERINIDGTALASAARTATTSSAALSNMDKKGIHVVLDVTVNPSSASIVLKIEGQDVLSGKYYTILEGAAVTATGTTVYKVFPGAAVVANSVANDIIPKTFRITVTHADSDSMTYSVGYSLV